MRLQYIASACVLVEHHGVRVLCDPWLTDGIYGGAWYHNPPLSVTPEDFHDVPYCYISHVHPDHADWETLKRLSRKTVILIGSYAEAFLGKQLRALGFTVLELPHDEPVVLGPDFTIQIIPADDCNPEACGKWIGCQIREPKEKASYQIDTLAVFRGGEHVIVNANDCPYQLARGALDRIVRDYGSPDLLCVGYAGAGPWPQCFDHLTLEQKQIEAAKKRDQMLAQARQFIDHLNPAHYLPFAGQYTLGGSLVDLNDLRGVPELEDLDDWGDARMVRLNRNSWWDCETETQSQPFVPFDKAQRLAYRESLRSRRLEHENDEWPTQVEINGLFQRALSGWAGRCEARGIKLDVRFIIQSAQLTPMWRRLWRRLGGRCPCDPLSLTFSGQGGSIEIEADARLWKRVLTRKINANNVEIASMFTYYREGAYSRALMNSMSYLHV